MFAKQTKQFNEVAIIDEGVFTKHLTVKVSFLCLIPAQKYVKKRKLCSTCKENVQQVYVHWKQNLNCVDEYEEEEEEEAQEEQ